MMLILHDAEPQPISVPGNVAAATIETPAKNEVELTPMSDDDSTFKDQENEREVEKDNASSGSNSKSLS